MKLKKSIVFTKFFSFCKIIINFYKKDNKKTRKKIFFTEFFLFKPNINNS
jgi:hypothetical protein